MDGTHLSILNPDPRYPRANLIEPTTAGYIYVAAAVRPSRIPLVLPSRRRARVVARVKELARELERVPGVVKCTVFRAIVMPPTFRFSPYLKQRAGSLQIANFDVVVLIETDAPESAHVVQTAPAYHEITDTLRRDSRTVRTLVARNAKRIGDVDTQHKGLFLFNHFVADEQGVMLELWDYLAGWYAVQTRLDNSVALVPEPGEKSDYAIVNWARWNVSPLRHVWHQLTKKSFWNYVTKNLEANHAASMPIYYRLA